MGVALGVLVAAAVAGVAGICGARWPLLGAPVIAIALGVAIRSSVRLPESLRPGLVFASRYVLQAAIVCSGFALSLSMVFRTGAETLPVMLVTIGVALALAPLAGRALRIAPATSLLVGVGTAICGASAIVAVAAVIEPAEAEVALAIAVIFCYNVAAVIAFPPLGHALLLSQHAFGVWAGTAVNDTSSVVAAGYAYGVPAGVEATVVKLTRACFILPIAVTLGAIRAVRNRACSPLAWNAIVPWFILWFLAAALANSTGAIPAAWHPEIAATVVALITVALAAIGLQTNVPQLTRAGARPLLFGFILWLSVALTSLAVQHAVGI